MACAAGGIPHGMMFTSGIFVFLDGKTSGGETTDELFGLVTIFLESDMF